MCCYCVVFLQFVLEQVSLTDSLTGLHNRRYLMSRIETDVALAERQVAASLEKGADLSEVPNLLFAMVDFDGLKEVNDSYGHEAGDLALLQMTRLLEEFRRKSDSLVRIGKSSQAK